jgi:HTH-type transcriptional regulator, sugar sensing transcriptional regulator
MNKEFEQELIELGLTKNESKIYLTLIQKGKQKASKIVEFSNIGSGKIYEILDSMQKKGFISKTKINNVKHFQASPPTKIKELIKEKQKSLDTIKQKAESLIPNLNKLYSKHEEDSKTELHKEDQGLKSALNEILKNISPREKVLVIGASSEGRTEYVNNLWFNFTNKLIKEKKGNMQIILSDKAEGTKELIKDLDTKVEIRHFEMFKLVPLTITNKYVLINDYQSANHILIKGENIAKSFKDMVKAIWKISK